jgi:hypothetical protein
MRSNFKGYFAALLLATTMAALTACDTRVPSAIPVNPWPEASSPTITPVYDPPFMTPNRLLVANFDNGLPGINPGLFNPSNPCPPAPTPTATVGCYAMALLGAVTVVNNFGNPGASQAVTTSWGPVLGGGAAGSSYGFRLQGAVTDGGDAVYPTLDLQAQVNGGALYDASFFTGVRFYLKVMPADDATKRIFAIPTFATQGTPSGGCTSNCYDHFFMNYENTNGIWRLYNVDFLSLGRQGFGAPMTPNNLAGGNLKQVLWLMWQEGRNNTAGTSTVDLWIDSIEFY